MVKNKNPVYINISIPFLSRFPVHSDVTFGSRLAVVFALRCCLELLNFKTWPISLQGPSHTIRRELMKRKLSNNWIELANRRSINVSRQKCSYQKGIFDIIGYSSNINWWKPYNLGTQRFILLRTMAHPGPITEAFS